MNLTITIDDDVLRRARIRALEQGTSVNCILREFLESYAGAEEEVRARHRLVEMAHGLGDEKCSGGRSWTRESIYEDRLERRASRVNEPE